MSDADDPIFDPWCLGDDGWPTPSQRTSRWRGAARDQSGIPIQRTIPGKRPVDAVEADFVVEGLGPGERPPAHDPEPILEPAPLEPDPTSAEVGEVAGVDDLAPAEPEARGEPKRPLAGAPPRPSRARTEREGPSLIELTDQLLRDARPTAGGDPMPGDEDPHAPPPPRVRARVRAAAPGRRPSRRSTDGPGEASPLRSLLIPRLERLGRRLAAERHGTTVDERLGSDPPSVRFRIDPRPGPFDLDERRGAVLEVVQEGGPDGVVAGRFWLDPTSGGPTERRGVPAGEADGAWLDSLLIDFVRKALR